MIDFVDLFRFLDKPEKACLDLVYAETLVGRDLQPSLDKMTRFFSAHAPRVWKRHLQKINWIHDKHPPFVYQHMSIFINYINIYMYVFDWVVSCLFIFLCGVAKLWVLVQKKILSFCLAHPSRPYGPWLTAVDKP